MDGTAIMQGVAVVFIAEAYGMLGTVILTATLASVGTAGVPGVGLVTLAMVLTSVGLPTEGIALIMGIDRILDMTRTAVNVTGDAVCTTIVAHKEGLVQQGTDIVCVLTGNGLKDPDNAIKYSNSDVKKTSADLNDIVKAMKSLTDVEKENTRLIQAYVQMIFAHIFSEMHMVEKESVGSEDLVYKSVEYVAKNFREKISLEQMAYDLGISKYVLSRLFAKTFHCNFAGYVNGIRLNYAISMLNGTNKPITTICFDSGFESQRTFNRVFKERYRVTPREYRLNMHTIETS